jgi:uncharacterized protein involved in exopolysaccharide biosynthesis
LAKYTPDHPVMQHLEIQFAACKAILDRQAPTRIETTTTVNRQHEETQKALLEEEPVLASIQARAAALRGQIEQVQGELRVFGENELRIAQLEREMETIQTSYRRCAANLEQTRVDQALDARHMSNLTVAQAASFDPRPVFPHTGTNLALGVLVGLFVGVAAALLKDSKDRRPLPVSSFMAAIEDSVLGVDPVRNDQAAGRDWKRERVAAV